MELISDRKAWQGGLVIRSTELYSSAKEHTLAAATPEKLTQGKTQVTGKMKCLIKGCQPALPFNSILHIRQHRKMSDNVYKWNRKVGKGHLSVTFNCRCYIGNHLYSSNSLVLGKLKWINFKSYFLIALLHFYLCVWIVCIYVYVNACSHLCQSPHVDIRGLFAGINSLLTSCGS